MPIQPSRITGSERRLVAFLAALTVITLSSLIGLDATKLGVLVTLTLGYIGQGVVKEVTSGKKP